MTWLTDFFAGATGKLVLVLLIVAAVGGVLYEFGAFEKRAAAGGAAQADVKNLQAQNKAQGAAITDQAKRQAAGDQVEAKAGADRDQVQQNFTPIEQGAADYAKAHPPRPAAATASRAAAPGQPAPSQSPAPVGVAVVAPVPGDPVLDAVGLCLWNAANRGAFDGSAGCGGDAGLPAAAGAPAAGRDVRADGAEPRGRDESLLAVRQGQPGQGRLDQPDFAERLTR